MDQETAIIAATIGFAGALFGALVGFVSNMHATRREFDDQERARRRDMFAAFQAARRREIDAEVEAGGCRDRYEAADKAFTSARSRRRMRTAAEALLPLQAEYLEALRKRSQAQTERIVQFQTLLLALEPGSLMLVTVQAVNTTGSPDQPEPEGVFAAYVACGRADLERRTLWYVFGPTRRWTRKHRLELEAVVALRPLDEAGIIGGSAS